MKTDEAHAKLIKIEKDGLIQNFIAQANSRYILLNTSESSDNFPPYTISDESLNLLGFYYLNIGCSFAENNELERASAPLEKGASILEHANNYLASKQLVSNYYGLIAALAYYVSFQYSKAFILTKKLNSDTVIAKLLYLFLRRDYKSLIIEIDKILIDKTYKDEFISENLTEVESDTKVYESTIARALDRFIDYAYNGNIDSLEKVKELLNAVKTITEIKNDPGLWWIVRLLLIISDSYKEASIWNVLNNFFDLGNNTTRTYIHSLTNQQPQGVFELFITQRKALLKVLEANSDGCVVSIPTSSGKTRIAEIAILDSLLRDPESKVLYIAPFVSLAFEIENAFGSIFSNLSYATSQLYGGNFYSKLDERVIQESNIIIATPEKSKAILRGNREVLNQIKLVIVDEGHLLGGDKRLIINEIFYEEIRYYLSKNEGKFLLLSAVLPNSEELAEWLTSNVDNVFKNSWRPSDERLGVLEWTGSSVNIEWKSTDTDRLSFNKNFITKQQHPSSTRLFPKNKNEAIASTAYKLSIFGKVLIFVGLKRSVFTMAEAFYDCIDKSVPDHIWKNSQDWKIFELSCIDAYGDDLRYNLWLKYARRGILCHNADLHSDVRLSVERLMRSDNPLVIISTSTLGQGVNLGVSTVIFSTLYQSGERISHRDFWNIAGRAGRAFVDFEGKIIIALDASKNSTYKEKSANRYQKEEALKYFDKSNIDEAISGILQLLSALKKIASNQNVSFELLLQLIAENKLQALAEEANIIDDALNWIDDALLSLHFTNNEHTEDEDYNYTWVEAYFRKSLAYIQASKSDIITGDEVLKFIEARVQGIVEKVGTNKNKWKSIIDSGLPLSSDLLIEERLPFIIDTIEAFYISGWTTQSFIQLQKVIEELLHDLPILLEEAKFISNDIDKIRQLWLEGAALSNILKLQNSQPIIKSLYSYKLPWILNGISKKLRLRDLVNVAEVMEELSILIEAGLPNMKSVKIYQAGIRSRTAAVEISTHFEDEIWQKSIKEYKEELLNNKAFYYNLTSENSREWINLFSNLINRKTNILHSFPTFEYGKVHERTTILLARIINGKQYLVSPDKSFIQQINNSDLDFASVSNISGIYFKYDHNSSLWKMQNDNPYLNTL